MPQVQTGDQVRLHYTARFVDGTVFASSREGGPLLVFRAGGEEVIAGVSQAVLGMAEGETKLLAIPPEQGFGTRDEALARRVPLADLPPSVRIGDQLNARAGAREIPVWVRAFAEDHAILDGNHPLAGHNLIFEIEVVSFHS